jgi:peptidyl-prolyl cis-trans isomerase SurA
MLLGVLLVAAGVWAAQSGETTTRVVLEEIVARVNNEIITRSDLERSQSQLRRELGDLYSGPQLQQEFQEKQVNLLRDLIDQNLLVQRGNDMGLSVEADVIKRMDRIRQELNLASMEELERQMMAQGQNPEDYKLQLRNQLLSSMVVQREVSGRVMISTEEVRAYYNEHREELNRPERIRLREILISTSGAEGEARVKELLGKIRAGEKFEELAKTYSDAPTGEDGGDLGYFEKDKLAPQIQETVEKLREGGVADPIQTQQGWLVLQLAEYIPAGIPPFEKVEGELTSKLYYERVQPALREFLSQLRREAFLFVKAGYVDSGAVEDTAPKPVRRGKRRRKKKPAEEPPASDSSNSAPPD